MTGDKLLFLTGASSGLGLATTEAFLAAGWRVAGTSRRPESLISRSGFHPFFLDMEDPASIRACWESVVLRHGLPDACVHNAGFGELRTLEATSASLWKEYWQVMFQGVVELCRFATAPMRARRSGCIANISSLAVDWPIPFMGGYNAVKSALSAYTASLELEERRHGVRIIDFRPGDFCSGFNERMAKRMDRHLTTNTEGILLHRMQELERKAPSAPKIARHLFSSINSGVSGIVRSGSFFQSRLAPIGARFLSHRWKQRMVIRYYRVAHIL